MVEHTTVRRIIERHTYLHNQVFDKKPKERKDSDIKALLDYESEMVEMRS